MDTSVKQYGEGKPTLFGKNKKELQELVKTLGLPKFTASQLCDWLYKKGATDFSAMTNLSLKARTLLDENFSIGRRAIEENTMESADGTKKYLYHIVPDSYIETVFIPDGNRATLCISSQVGCKMNCLFCATGKQGFGKNLSAGEILNQIYSVPEFKTLSNIVYMGMGEPLDNIEEVLKSIEILTAEWGLNISPRRITVSSVGIQTHLDTFLRRCECHLAISLHNPFHEERLSIMPMEHRFPIAKTIDILRRYDWTKQRRLSFEYIMFKGVNDSSRHINALLRLFSGLPCRVNLIRFHAIPGIDLQSSSEETMVDFRNTLSGKGIITTIRTSRGEDILAACGLLSTKQKQE